MRKGGELRAGLRLKKWFVVLGLCAAIGVVFVFAQMPPDEPSGMEEQFSPAHLSIGEAVSHFFGIRPEPRQPIAFVHKVHVETAELTCVDCHITVARGPRASIPDIRTCWGCHAGQDTDHPEMAKIGEYYEKGQDIPWQRVYGWNEEAHVRFNHEPHVRAEVECATCHGDVAQMDVAQRVVNHGMGFCIACHQQRQASIDCLTCHY